MRLDALVEYEAATRARFDSDFALQRLESLGLDPRKRLQEHSNGQKAQIALVLAVATRPSLLVLDDPALGLDTHTRRALFDELIGLIREREVGVLLTSHLLPEVERIADRVSILAEGRVAFEGNIDSIRANAARVHVPTRAGCTPPRVGDPGVLAVGAKDSGWDVLLWREDATDNEVAGVALTLLSRWLADRAARNHPFRLRIGPPRFTALGTTSVAVSALLLFALLEHQAGAFLARDTSKSAPYVMYDDAGHLALARRVSGVLMQVAVEGAPFPSDPGASRWYTMHADASAYVPTRSAPRVPGTLSDFVRLGVVRGDGTSRSSSVQVFVLQPRGLVFLGSLNSLQHPQHERTSTLLARHPGGGPLQVGARIAALQHQGAHETTDGYGLAVFDLDGQQAFEVRSEGVVRPIEVGDDDSVHGVRHEVNPRSDGKDDDTRVVLIGTRGEYLWSETDRAFVSFEDTTPPPPTYRLLDPVGRRVEVAGVTVERWSSGLEYMLNKGAAPTFTFLLRAPLESAVDALRFATFETPPMSLANRESFLGSPDSLGTG